jgi:hypothetical protein
VLLVGGYPSEGSSALSTAEVFDPGSETFHRVGNMPGGRADHTATLLGDGRVLVAGGTSGDGRALDTTAVFDPVTGRFEPGPPLRGGRSGHAAVVAAGRLVLLGGTADFDTALASSDVLDRGTWGVGPELREARTKHAAVALPDGSILVIGGATDADGRDLLSSTEVLDLAAGRSRPGPQLAEGQYKLDGAVAALSDGRVVIGGGRRMEVYDPAAGKLFVLDSPPIPRRSFVSLSPIGHSSVLVSGGYDSAINPTAESRLIHIP